MDQPDGEYWTDTLEAPTSDPSIECLHEIKSHEEEDALGWEMARKQRWVEVEGELS